MSTPLPSDRFGPYQILARIGEGGMGDVYRARDTRLDRIVAIKVVKGGFSERFDREAKTIASLNHPHICTLHDVGPDYLVMELVEGAPVNGPLPLKEVLRLSQQICEALDTAHRKGIVHRDLKPANILVNKNGVKLLDFGLAKGKTIPPGDTGVTLTQSLTRDGAIIGTVPYMAPEQLQGAEADVRSDIFSLGCVLYEMVTGRRPFQGKTQVSIIAAILEHEPEPISRIQPLTPPSLERVIRTCLAKDPDDRWQSARDVAIALKSLALDQTDVTKAEAVGPEWKRWMWPAATAAVVLVAAAVWLSGRPAATPSFPLRLQAPSNSAHNLALSLSPDGRSLLFFESTSAIAGQGFWLRMMDTGSVRRVMAGPIGSSMPIWSPDSRYLAILSEGKLQRTPVAGGSTELICALNGSMYGGSWSPEGKLLVSTDEGLFQAPAAGGNPSPALRESPKGEIRSAQFLPGGKRFLFYLVADASISGTYLGELGGTATRILPGRRGIYAKQGEVEILAFVNREIWGQRFDSRTGRLAGEAVKLDDAAIGLSSTVYGAITSQNGIIAWHSLISGQATMVWVDLNGQGTGVLKAPVDAANPRISADGARVAYTISGLRAIGWSDVTRGSMRTVLRSETNLYYHPVWSPDRTTFAYREGRSLFLKDADSDAESTILLKLGGQAWPQDWTRDGRHIAYVVPNGSTSSFDLMALPMSGNKKAGDPFLVLRTPQEALHTSVSPDGGWLAFNANESGKIQVFVTAFADQTHIGGRGPRWAVSSEGGMNPKWSPDGKRVYFISGDEKKLMVADFKPGNPPVIGAPRVQFERSFTWNTSARSTFEVDPTGKRFLVVDPVAQEAQPIQVLSNFAPLFARQ